jgi:uncharacterized membrane protein
MLKITKRFMVFILIMSLGLVPFGSAALAEDQHDEEKGIQMAADILVVRPLGIVATVGGTVLAIVALPFSLLGGNTDEVFHYLVVKPAKFTFVRPLGDFD